MVQWLVCRLILDNLLSGAKYSCISPRRNYPKFYRNFLKNSDNGRFSLKVTNTFSLKTTSIKLKNSRFVGRVLVKSQYGTVACLSSYPR
jgi:hypothetical protein